MEKPLLVLKPSMINALFPILLRSMLLFTIPFFFIYVGLGVIPRSAGLDGLFPSIDILTVLLIIFCLSLIPTSLQMLVLANTKYYFFEKHALYEFRLFAVKRHSAPYSRVVNIKVDIGIWDRICNTGTLVLHTAENQRPDLAFKHLKDPLGVEKKVNSLMHKNREEQSLPSAK